MSDQSPISERLCRAFSTPSRGILGLVDELLTASCQHGLQLAWRAGCCRFRILDGGSAGPIEVPLQKSVFRAVLARVAALCNERKPNSVSPYGGQGEVSVDADPATAIRVTFVNSPDELSLEMSSVRNGTSEHGEAQSTANIAEELGRSLPQW